MIRQNKQYFIYHLKDSVLIFDVFDYIEELAADYVDYCFEWKIVKDNFVSDKSKIIKGYLESHIEKALDVINKKLTESNCKILCYFYKKENYNDWQSFFKNPERFIKVSKSIFKKQLPNFVETDEKGLFTDIKGTFDNIPCLMPSGEDLEFILKNKKKLR
jgi:hypothetical protein